MNTPTPNQKLAITAPGNLLVVAGAGAGKTRTLVQRCVSFLMNPDKPGSLDEILMVTFTEAAAAEMKKRIRSDLEERLRGSPNDAHLHEQIALLDSARICTLHSFCFQLVRDHFFELSLDPQISILPEAERLLLIREVLDDLLSEIYAGQGSYAEPVQRLVQDQARGWDKSIRELVVKLHAYQQTLPDPAAWIAEQQSRFREESPTAWLAWFEEELARWCSWWQQVLAAQDPANKIAKPSQALLEKLSPKIPRAQLGEILDQILAWPKAEGIKISRDVKPIEDFFQEAEFLRSLCDFRNGIDPLVEDWEWVKPHIAALLDLTREFSNRFAQAKRESASVDFQDLEQFALQILWDSKAQNPTATARRWQERLRLILVDEYQDINQAQDTIIKALARAGAASNRFLVGDVKQSIYGFRLANPRIFLDYARAWEAKEHAQVVPLSENFRSHEAILNFVNPLFTTLMRQEIGGIQYDETAALRFGNRQGRGHFLHKSNTPPRVELHLRIPPSASPHANGDSESLSSVESEVRLVATRLRQMREEGTLIWENDQQRAVRWSDMVILLRALRGKAEAYAKEFARAGIPLEVARGGFYKSLEVQDVLNLLRLLDNPLQDVPLLAALRSPIVSLTVDELAQIRVARARDYFWRAMIGWREASGNSPDGRILSDKIDRFLKQWRRWRELRRELSLSQLMETILDESHYADWLLGQPRGQERHANLQRLVEMTRQFDALRGQGLFRFIRLVETQEEEEIDSSPAADSGGDAVRLMTIHKSKGLEFPVVVVADLGKKFNFGDKAQVAIVDEVYGICPRITPPGTRQTYPSLPLWLARRRQRNENLGEELRLLYVATTRAAEYLLLTGTVSKKTIQTRWKERAALGLDVQEIAAANSALDWIGPWLAANAQVDASGSNELLSWTFHENEEALAKSQPAPQPAITGPAENIPESDLAALQQRLDWEYPFAAATKEPAKTSVSALRRRLDPTEEEARPLVRTRLRSSDPTKQRNLSAAQLGTAHHTFFEFVSLEEVGSETRLRAEAARLGQEGILADEEIAALDFEAIAHFWRSDIGQLFLTKREHLKREHPFTARWKTPDAHSPPPDIVLNGDVSADHDFVVLQGVVDLAAILPDEIWLLDFKTDQLRRESAADRAQVYQTQVQLYADAMARIYEKPVTKCWLHFLNVRESVEVDPTSLRISGVTAI